MRFKKTKDSAEVAQLRAELESLMFQAAQGDQYALTALRGDRDNHGRWTKFLMEQNDSNLTTQFHKAIEDGLQTQQFNTRIEKIGQVFATWSRASNFHEQTTALITYLRALETNGDIATRAGLAFQFTTEQALNTLDTILLSRCNALLQQAEAGSTEAFNEVERLIQGTRNRNHRESPFHNLPIAQLEHPENWDELVVRHVAQPHRAQFRERKIEPRGFFAIALKAERERDVVSAWYILSGWFDGCSLTRFEVPSDLITQLGRIIADAHKESTN